MLKVQILIDNSNSWIIPYAKILVKNIKDLGHYCEIIFKHKQVEKGDILCLLSCEKIFHNLSLNKNNIVIHESKLPEGKGWSPVSWQILENKNTILATLFEAEKELDSGKIYNQKEIQLQGNELNKEIKEKQGLITIELILDFIKNYPNNQSTKQEGKSTFYKKRTPNDSKLDINKSIKEQFNLLRICDNDRYPAFFTYKKKKYILKIFNEDS